MAKADNTIEINWTFRTGRDHDSGLVFDHNCVAILRLRDNLATKAHMARAPLRRAPFVVGWGPEGRMLF